MSRGADLFMLTATGREYALGGYEAMVNNPPSLQDIAHQLAQINRFTGAASRPYSVAEHSLLTERIGAARGAQPGLRLALLMHDAHEAYTNDLATPAKRAVGLGWHGFESTHTANLRHYFGLRTAFAAHRQEIAQCDLIALATERRDLMPFDPKHNRPWPVLDTPGSEIAPSATEHLCADDSPFTWRQWRDAFLHRYLHLRELQQATTRSTAPC